MKNSVDVDVDEDENENVYINYDISTYPSDLTLRGVLNLWESEGLIIPDFQRNYVWTMKQASLLIDSFISGLPVPPVFLYVDNKNKNKSLIIDGQQRILSIIFFLQGYFGYADKKDKKKIFKLDLGEHHPLNNLSFKNMPEDKKRQLLDLSVLRAMNIRQLAPDDGTSAYHIFERLNTGGTPLLAQEIRNCVFHGEFANTLKELNTIDQWRDIIGKKDIDSRQKDVEWVLRTLAFMYNQENYEKPMKEFLNKFMKANLEIPKPDMFDLFRNTVDVIYSRLGIKPFHLRGPINASAMDSIFTCIGRNITSLPDDLKERYDTLKNNENFIEYTSFATTDKNTIDMRYDLTKKILID